MKYIFVFITFVCFLTACNSGKHFTSRKYTSGRYVSHVTHKERINKNTAESEKPIAIKKTVNQKAEILSKKTEDEKVILANVDVPVSIKTKSEKNTVVFSNKKTEQVKNYRIAQVFNKKTFKRLTLKTASKPAQKPGTKSLTSVLLSGGGLIVDIVGFILAIVSVEYIFLALLAVGLTLGIVGLIMGIQGMKEYREEKHNGNKNTTTLVLGIIGTSLGGVAIFLAAYFCIVGAVLVSVGGI